MTEKKKLNLTRAAAPAETPKASPDFSRAFIADKPAEPMKRISALVTESRHLKIKRYALDNGKTVTDLLNGFIDSL